MHLSLPAASALVSLLLIASAATAGVDLPVISWDPGLPDGIPEITGPVQSVMDHGAVADGATNDLGAFQAALSALPEGGVLLVPAGDYFLDGSLEIGTDGVVLRGEGADQSRLLLGNAETASISVITYGRGDWQTLTAAVLRGDKSATVPDASAFTVGQWAEIQKADDPALMYTDPAWEVDWAYNSRGQVLEVTAVDGNVVTFRHPLYLDYPLEDSPQIRSQRLVQHVGIEKLYLERVTNDSDVSTVLWKNAAYLWMREVESRQTRKAHLATETVIGCQIENNYLHHSYDYGGGGHGYGTSLGFHTTDCLIENNVFESLRHAMIIQLGASGNVFGYNHSDEVVQSEGTVPNEGWLPPDISVHGHWSNNNLFESNTVEQMGIADYWGPTGPHVLYLRNRVVNDEVRSDNRSETESILIGDHSNYQYLLGNVIENGTLTDDGTPDMSTNLVHGHVEGGATVWDPGVADREISASHYWACKPNFLGDKAWPLVGPDVSPSVSLPAGDRLAAGSFIAASYDRGCAEGGDGAGGGGAAAGGAAGAEGALGTGGDEPPGGAPGTGGGSGTSGDRMDASPGSGQGQAASEDAETGGCGCRVLPRSGAGPWGMAGMLLAGMLLRVPGAGRRGRGSGRARLDLSRGPFGPCAQRGRPDARVGREGPVPGSCAW